MDKEKMHTYLTLEMFDPDDTELIELGFSEEELEEYHQVRDDVRKERDEKLKSGDW